MADWRDTIGETMREARSRGLSAVDLARLAVEEVAGGDAGATGVTSAFGHAFGIPLAVHRAIRLWREFNAGLYAISDEEFELIVTPWLSADFDVTQLPLTELYEPDWRGTTVEALREGKAQGLLPHQLALLARERLGADFDPATFKVAIFHAFEIPYQDLREVLLWRGFHTGPDAISDEDLEVIFSLGSGFPMRSSS